MSGLIMCSHLKPFPKKEQHEQHHRQLRTVLSQLQLTDHKAQHCKMPTEMWWRSPIGSKRSRQKMYVDHRHVPGQARENKQWAGAPTRCPQSRQTSHPLKCFPPDCILGATAKQEGNQKWYFGVWLDCTGNCRFCGKLPEVSIWFLLRLQVDPRIRSALIIGLKSLEAVTWFLFLLQRDPTWRTVLVVSAMESSDERLYCFLCFKNISGDRRSSLPEQVNQIGGFTQELFSPQCNRSRMLFSLSVFRPN